MKQHVISKQLCSSLFIIFSALTFFPAHTDAQSTATSPRACISETTGGTAECCDGVDNDNDGRADYYGTSDKPSDPKCLYFTDTEQETNPSTSDIVPCTDKCTLESVFQLANNIISFFFRVLLIPIFIVMLLYLGVQYFQSQGNVNVHKKVLSQFKHLIIGLLLILCAWLIVRTILTVVLDDNTEVGKGALQFFE